MAKIQSDNYVTWKGDLIKLTVSSNTTLTSVQEVITLDASGGSFTVEMPDTTTLETGKKIWFFDNGSASTNNITIVPNASDGTTIDGGDQYVIARDNETTIFECISATWTLMNQHNTTQIASVAANYTEKVQDELILADSTAGNITVTLLPSADVATKELIIKKADASAINKVTIDANGAETIDTNLTVDLVGNKQPYLRIVSDGTNRRITGIP